MKRTVAFTITVNDLAIALARQYHLTNVLIEKAEVGDITNQHHPFVTDIGVGGVCTLTFAANVPMRKKK